MVDAETETRVGTRRLEAGTDRHPSSRLYTTENHKHAATALRRPKQVTQNTQQLFKLHKYMFIHDGHITDKMQLNSNHTRCNYYTLIHVITSIATIYILPNFTSLLG